MVLATHFYVDQTIPSSCESPVGDRGDDVVEPLNYSSHRRDEESAQLLNAKDVFSLASFDKSRTEFRNRLLLLFEEETI